MKAILQVADTGPLESLVVMLRAVGVECYLPNIALKDMLRRLGCDTVLGPDDLVRGMGYDVPIKLPYAGPDMMETCDLYIDVKAHRNGPKVWARWPRLKNRTMWYRINGGYPEHVIRADGEDCGDEVHLNCPIITPNQWYKRLNWEAPDKSVHLAPWSGKSYVMWPPFRQWADYYDTHGRHGFSEPFGPPVCLIHNAAGWGYGALFENMRAMGLKIHGRGSPNGLIQHGSVPFILSRALAMVHLKSNDCPGYALYEAMAAGCPLVVSRRLIWRMSMYDLLIPGETCLVFDRETHDALDEQDVRECTQDISGNLKQLMDPTFNRQIGMAGRERLQELMWTDRGGFGAFLSHHAFSNAMTGD